MAKSTSGKWVSRVGSAGGGKTYTKARPSNFYAILVLIVVVGLALVVYSRYEYQHPLKKVVIATGYWDDAVRRALASRLRRDAAVPDVRLLHQHVGFIVEPDDVIQVSPVSAADAGNNATAKDVRQRVPGTRHDVERARRAQGRGHRQSRDDVQERRRVRPEDEVRGPEGQGRRTPTGPRSTRRSRHLTTNPASIKFTKRPAI